MRPTFAPREGARIKADRSKQVGEWLSFCKERSSVLSQVREVEAIKMKLLNRVAHRFDTRFMHIGRAC